MPKEQHDPVMTLVQSEVKLDIVKLSSCLLSWHTCRRLVSNVLVIMT